MGTNSDDNKDSQVTRRDFLRQGGCAALGSTGALSTLFNLQMTSIAAAQTQTSDDDYKALICIFLGGGNDSYNMLVPTEPSEYANYQTVRGSIALPITGTDALLPLNALETNGRQFSIHSALPDVQSLFDAGNIAFVANVGTLVEPTTVAQYQNNGVQLPRSLFSHTDQKMQWQTVVPQSTTPTGWAGRMADILTDPSASETISMNISLNGNNIWQTGNSTSSYSISEHGAVAIRIRERGEHATDIYNLIAGEADEDVTSLIGQEYANLFKETYTTRFKQSIDSGQYFAERFEASGQANDFSAFDNALTGNGSTLDKTLNTLKAVAQTIGARHELGMRRQVFFLSIGEWDHHNELLNTHHTMLGYVNAGLKALWETLVKMGLQDNVLTFTASDFGRSLRTNGRGTDHGWGGHQLVMGGAPLHGRRIHGSYPTAGELTLAQGLDVGKNGRMLPTTSVDEFMAEMALWFGVDYSELETVFPNIRNFYSPGVDYLPIGYLDDCAMPTTACATNPTAISLSQAEAIAAQDRLRLTKSGLVFGTGLAGTAALIALRNRANRKD